MKHPGKETELMSPFHEHTWSTHTLHNSNINNFWQKGESLHIKWWIISWDLGRSPYIFLGELWPAEKLEEPKAMGHPREPPLSKSMYVCVCESNSVPKRSKLLSWEFSWCSCRGTQEAHRAVSNEALYGVFRISGPITLTYLHLWNCWQAVLIPCFPALGPRTLSPHTIIIAFNQFLSRSFLFSLFNCFKTGVSQVFFQLWFCALTYSWPSINVHAAFSPAWNYIAYGKL